LNPMNSVSQFLKSRSINDLSREVQLIELLKVILAIPWGEARSIDDVLTKNMGTCTGKHLLLQACLDKLGFEYQPVVCTFFWGEQEIDFPNDIQDIINEGEWEHTHNFVKIKDHEGIWLDIDVAWDPLMNQIGFKIFPEEWDGRTSFIGLEKMNQRWDNVDVNQKKKELFDLLTPEERERRGRFLKHLFPWIESLR